MDGLLVGLVGARDKHHKQNDTTYLGQLVGVHEGAVEVVRHHTQRRALWFIGLVWVGLVWLEVYVSSVCRGLKKGGR